MTGPSPADLTPYVDAALAAVKELSESANVEYETLRGEALSASSEFVKATEPIRALIDRQMRAEHEAGAIQLAWPGYPVHNHKNEGVQA